MRLGKSSWIEAFADEMQPVFRRSERASLLRLGAIFFKHFAAFDPRRVARAEAADILAQAARGAAGGRGATARRPVPRQTAPRRPRLAAIRALMSGRRPPRR